MSDFWENKGYQPVMISCMEKNLEKFKELLTDESVKCMDPYFNSTLLHVACEEESLEMLKMILIKKTININALDWNGDTPLHIACSMGNLEIARLLLEHGAELEIKNLEGKIPLIEVLENDPTNITNFFNLFYL